MAMLNSRRVYSCMMHLQYRNMSDLSIFIDANFHAWFRCRILVNFDSAPIVDVGLKWYCSSLPMLMFMMDEWTSSFVSGFQSLKFLDVSRCTSVMLRLPQNFEATVRPCTSEASGCCSPHEPCIAMPRDGAARVVRWWRASIPRVLSSFSPLWWLGSDGLRMVVQFACHHLIPSKLVITSNKVKTTNTLSEISLVLFGSLWEFWDQSTSQLFEEIWPHLGISGPAFLRWNTVRDCSPLSRPPLRAEVPTAKPPSNRVGMVYAIHFWSDLRWFGFTPFSIIYIDLLYRYDT